MVRQQATRRGGGAVRQLAGSEKVDTKGFTYHLSTNWRHACGCVEADLGGALGPARPSTLGSEPEAAGAIRQLAGSRYWPAALGWAVYVRRLRAHQLTGGGPAGRYIYVCGWGEERRERERSPATVLALTGGTRQLVPTDQLAARSRQLTAPNGGPKFLSPAHDEFCA